MHVESAVCLAIQSHPVSSLGLSNHLLGFYIKRLRLRHIGLQIKCNIQYFQCKYLVGYLHFFDTSKDFLTIDDRF